MNKSYLFKKIINKKYIKVFNYNNFLKKKKIYIKFGIDPTDKHIHLGHFIILNTIKQLQKINFYSKIIIGCHTALIGDTSKKFDNRKKLSYSKIISNYKKIKQTVKNILKRKTYIYNNDKWLKNINIRQLESINLKKLLTRKEIKNKLLKNINIKIGELIYPYYQNYDNLILKPDLEFGGQDQIFNFFYSKKKVCNIVFDLFPSLREGNKMSSSNSKNSCIYYNDSPLIIFWKILKTNDSKIDKIMHFLNIKKEKKKIKNKLNLYIYVCKEFKKKKYKKILNNFLKNKKVYIKTKVCCSLPLTIKNLIYKTNFFKSKKHIKTIIRQNGLKINDKLIKKNILITNKKKLKLKIGRYYFKICINTNEK
ncbi:tyrosine--tRNA ligase [Candidatus Vidania fulgoroideorum]